MKARLRIFAPLVTFLVLCAPAAVASASREAAEAGERAVSEYLAGHYSEALPGLEKARDAGIATGPQIYMLGYCYEAVRHDQEAAKRTYASARVKLEAETSGKKPALESYFYLSNLHLNLGDKDRSQKVAKEAIAAIAAKKLKIGKDGISQFRAGKLHTDAGETKAALEYYRGALPAFSKEKNVPPAYLERSIEPVAREDLGKGDPAAVSDMWEKLLQLNPRVTEGQWNMGLAALRASRYPIARDAFKKAKEPLSERSQEAFYAERLAEGAATLVTGGGAPIPSKDADGKVIADLSDEEIEARVKDYAKKAADLLSHELQPDEYRIEPPLGPKAKPRLLPSKNLEAQIGDVRRVFIALVTERFFRTKLLQEHAFTGGYAPLVIQDWISLWRNNHRPLIEEAAKAREGKSDPKPN